MCRDSSIPGLGFLAAIRRGCAWAGAMLLGGVLLAQAPEFPVPLTLEAESDREFYLEGASNEIYIQARIRTGESEDPAGRGEQGVRNIAFVLDRSGSMDGARMQAAQAAVAEALDELADRDLVSIVLFSSEVDTAIEAQRSDDARDRFARLGPIQAAGGAALYEGLSQGAAQVRRYATPGAASQIIVLTDGEATKGPRELDDFVKLADSLARDGIRVSTIGLGDEFNEDLLAGIARAGGGQFHYAPDLEHVAAAFRAETSRRQTVVARDAVVTIEFRPICRNIEAHGTRPAVVEKSTVSFTFRQLTAGQELGVLASGELEAYRTIGVQRDLVRVRLRWTDPESGETREVTQSVTVRFSTESRDVTRSYNIRVYRAAVAALISEGMQDAIEELDKGDFRRALRELRRARSRARDANFYADDAEITAMVQRLDSYIAEVQARGMNRLDRKVLRSGLFNQFDAPVSESEPAEKP